MRACICVENCSNFVANLILANDVKIFFVFLLRCMFVLTISADGINYDGTKLTLNNDFTRSECGTAYQSVMPEVSGLACSRETPGYLWLHGDENTGGNKKIVAIEPIETLAMTVTISSDPER